MGEVVEDEQAPKRQTFMSSVKDGLRRSFRSSMRRMSGIRNSFRRSGGRGSRSAKTSVADAAAARQRARQPAVATIQNLSKETSEIHPAYLKQTIKMEDERAMRHGEPTFKAPSYSQALEAQDDPTAGFGGSIKAASNPDLSLGMDMQPCPTPNYPNPLYQREGQKAKTSGLDKVRSHISGYRQMEEEEADESPTHRAQGQGRVSRAAVVMGSGYSNDVYQEDSPVHHPPAQRYDLPYEEGHGRGQGQIQNQGQGQNLTGGKGIGHAANDLGSDTLPGADERNYSSESTYI